MDQPAVSGSGLKSEGTYGSWPGSAPGCAFRGGMMQKKLIKGPVSTVSYQSAPVQSPMEYAVRSSGHFAESRLIRHHIDISVVL